MKTLKRNSVLALLLLASLTLVGCSTNSSKQDGSDSADSMVDDAASNYALELNGTSDESTAGPLRTIFFDYDSSSLSGAARTALEDAANFLKESTNVDIQVEGHADERGGHQYNLALGERRARSIKDYLVALGVNDSRVSIISYGKEKPNAFGHDEESWSKNRRASFMITAK
jgi:peptidoglycan-associated lipoprotein